MNIAGIVGEYNPFHKGHEYHINKTRELIGENGAVVCVMSGDFVQRGEPAAMNKHARAEAAVRCGADLVIELPLPWSIASAERFAHAAVRLLDSLGVIGYLSFGSECGDVEALYALASALRDPVMQESIKAELSSGISYAAARQKALEKLLGNAARFLETPNNILAVEYLKALSELNSPMKPLTVQRVGAEHDSIAGYGIRSASEIRALMLAGEDISELLPEKSVGVYLRERQNGRCPVTARSLEQAIMSRLRALPAEAFELLPDAGEGLGNRLYSAAQNEPTLDAVLAAAKTKRYAMSRIRRMVMCAALGVTAEMQAAESLYARVLACNECGRKVLKEISEASEVKIITKPASARELEPDLRQVFEVSARARDLYVLGYGAAEERRGGTDWMTSPAIVYTK